MSKKNLVIIQGPTAVGKTSVSIKIAQQFNCPIVSADSRQFFKEMSVGTAKPTTDEMKGVPHYFIDSHSITEDFNVGEYEKKGLLLLEKLFREHDIILLAGGSGLYIDAICKGFDKLPKANKEVRQEIQNLLMSEGIEALQNKLQKLDPEYYKQVDLQNPQRLSRALEVCITSGKPYSELRKGQNKERDFNCIKIGLNLKRELLYNNINKRVDEMLEAGLLEEVKSLQNYKHLNALQTVGYKELFEYLDNKYELEQAVELIKQNTRRFAKRQLTWFRKDEEIKWFEPDQLEDILVFIENKMLES